MPSLPFSAAQTGWRGDYLIKLVVRHIAAVDDAPERRE